MGALGRSWALLGRSWDALGTLLGRSWGALGSLLDVLKSVGTILERPSVDFEVSGIDFEVSEGRSWATYWREQRRFSHDLLPLYA